MDTCSRPDCGRSEHRRCPRTLVRPTVLPVLGLTLLIGLGLTLSAARAAPDPGGADFSSATATPPAADSQEWILSATARAELVAQLADQPAGSATWIVYDGRDAAAQALAKAIAAAFVEARWQVRRIAEAPIPLKPGIYLLAPTDPTSACSTVAKAFERAGFTAILGTGYRAFVEDRRRNNPNHPVIDFEADQQFVIAIGRRPS